LDFNRVDGVQEELARALRGASGIDIACLSPVVWLLVLLCHSAKSSGLGPAPKHNAGVESETQAGRRLKPATPVDKVVLRKREFDIRKVLGVVHFLGGSRYHFLNAVGKIPPAPFSRGRTDG
jgi:hypothetical protein